MTVATYEAPLPDTDSWTLVVEQVAVLATRIAQTELVPEHLRNHPAAIAAVILYGREVGLPPMTSLRTVYVANGRVGLHAEAQRGLALSRGHEIVYRDSSSATCRVAGRRHGDETWHEVTWTIDDARKAGLLGNPSWQKYPRAMLKARATAELCRDLFADVLGGFEAVEEMDDGEAPPEPRRRVRRGRTSGDPTGPRSPEVPVVEAPTPRALRSVEDVPLPGEEPPGAPTTTTADVDEALARARANAEAGLGAVRDVPAQVDQPDEVDPYTPEQRRAMHAAFNDLGITDRQHRLDVTSAMLGHDVKSANELSRDEVSQLLDMLRLALDSPEPRAMIDDLVRAAGLVVNDPMFGDDGEPVP